MNGEFVIDAGPMGGGVSGAGRYAYRLLDELVTLDTDIPFEIIVPPPEATAWNVSGWGESDNVRLRTANVTGLGPRRHIFYARGRLRCRAHHSLSSYVPLVLDSDVTLVTIHDLKEFEIPEYLAGKSRLKRTYIKWLVARSIRVADHVLTISEHTKSDIVARFDIDESDITVVPLGPGSGRRSVGGEPPVSGPYILFVGAVRRHKNIRTLIEGFQAYRRRFQDDLSLVIAGTPEPTYRAELDTVVADRYREDVHFLGHVDEGTVARLYDGASAFVFPSLYEGFGLPPLEAMAYDTPVIASDRASIPEVVDDAGVYFDPDSPLALADTLTEVLSDANLRERLVGRGRERVSEFSWERTAHETLAVYERLWSR